MIARIRTFLIVEAIVFVLAAAVHYGLLIDGYEHTEARIAESIVAVVLFGGFVVTVLRPDRTRLAGIAAQAFALLGTLIGLFTILVGVGPRTLLDVVYHFIMLGVLLWGFAVAWRMPVAPRLP